MINTTSLPAPPSAEEQAVVQSALEGVSRTGRISFSTVASAADGAARTLVRRVIASALEQPHDVQDGGALARSLKAHPTVPALGGATAAALALRVARRAGPLRIF